MHDSYRRVPPTCRDTTPHARVFRPARYRPVRLGRIRLAIAAVALAPGTVVALRGSNPLTPLVALPVLRGSLHAAARAEGADEEKTREKSEKFVRFHADSIR